MLPHPSIPVNDARRESQSYKDVYHNTLYSTHKDVKNVFEQEIFQVGHFKYIIVRHVLYFFYIFNVITKRIMMLFTPEHEIDMYHHFTLNEYDYHLVIHIVNIWREGGGGYIVDFCLHYLLR